MQTESHLLDAFFFVAALFFAVKYFGDDTNNYPLGFFVFAVLAGFTRYISLLLIPVFLLIMLIDSRRSTWRTIRQSALVFGGLFLAWVIYNYVQNGVFLTSIRWNVIGLSFISNGLADYSVAEWLYVEYFHYSGFLDFLSSHPAKFIRNFLLNIGNIASLVLYDFSPLGVFAPAVGIGLIVTILNSDEVDYCFLLVIFALYCFFVTMTWTKWIYFLHLFSVLAAIGFQSVYKYLLAFRFTTKFRLPGRSMVFVSLILVGLLFQVNARLSLSRDYLSNGFRTSIDGTKPRIKQYVEGELRKFGATLNKPVESYRIGTMTYPGQVYRVGFRPTIAPLPTSSVREVFCYQAMPKGKLRLVTGMSHPLGLGRMSYVPADYLLTDRYFRVFVSRHQTIKPDEFFQYLRDVPEWESKYGVELYKIKKQALDC